MQFQRVANCYFLMITCLQTVKSVSITHGTPSTAVPLMAVFVVAAMKEIGEDMTRHRSDNEENTSVAHLIINNDTAEVDTKDVPWEELRVGDVVEVSEFSFNNKPEHANPTPHPPLIPLIPPAGPKPRKHPS